MTINILISLFASLISCFSVVGGDFARGRESRGGETLSSPYQTLFAGIHVCRLSLKSEG